MRRALVYGPSRSSPRCLFQTVAATVTSLHFRLVFRTGDFFEVGEYPTITFAATAARPDDAGRVRVEGTLTVHGQTRPLTVLANVSVNGTVATADAEVDLDRSDWGLTWAKMGAAVTNRVTIHAQWIKA